MAKQQKIIILFFIKAIALYLVWYFLYENWLIKVGWADGLIIDNLVYLNEKTLSLLGYTTFVYGHTVGIDGSHGVYIGTPCNGIDLMALFAGFILIFNGNWKNKLWYIPLGLLIIHLLNLIRVLALTIMAKLAPEYLDFNHKYTFTIMLYGIVFLGWMLWVKYFAVKKSSTS
jgi:exosortase family protein XrtF